MSLSEHLQAGIGRTGKTFRLIELHKSKDSISLSWALIKSYFVDRQLNQEN
jgi:hypothetical protein